VVSKSVTPTLSRVGLCDTTPSQRPPLPIEEEAPIYCPEPTAEPRSAPGAGARAGDRGGGVRGEWLPKGALSARGASYRTRASSRAALLSGRVRSKFVVV